MEPVAERFIRYARINTQSDPRSDRCPSTSGQIELGKLLVKDLLETGLKHVQMNPDGYVWGTLPSNSAKKLPVIGFLAHMDTSPDFPGKGVNPVIINDYDGSAIKLNEEGISLDPEEFPELKAYAGQDLIVTDGKTLLGADDKAGIAEIIEAVRYFTKNEDIEHGRVMVGFTPDEEIGRGADRFPLESFGADFAYTLDGGPVGELEYENFNAAGAIVNIMGRNVHPGTAKGKMINAIQTGIDFHNMLPAFDRPEHTEGRQGFYHLTNISGNVENARLDYIIRDHDLREFENRKDRLKVNSELINRRLGREVVSVLVKDQYYNMREKIEPVMHIVDLAVEAMKNIGIKPIVKPVRGGTDGSKLSYMGLPTPNLFTGGHNFHGKFEFIPVQSMLKSVSLIKEIISLAVRKEWKGL